MTPVFFTTKPQHSNKCQHCLGYALDGSSVGITQSTTVGPTLSTLTGSQLSTTCILSPVWYAVFVPSHSAFKLSIAQATSRASCVIWFATSLDGFKFAGCSLDAMTMGTPFSSCMVVWISAKDTGVDWDSWTLPSGDDDTNGWANPVATDADSTGSIVTDTPFCSSCVVVWNGENEMRWIEVQYMWPNAS